MNANGQDERGLNRLFGRASTVVGHYRGTERARPAFIPETENDMTLVIFAFFMVVSLSIAIFVGIEREQQREHKATVRASRKTGFGRR